MTESEWKKLIEHVRSEERLGAKWTVDGAIQTAKARAAWLSGDWRTLCVQRALLPLAIRQLLKAHKVGG